MYKVQSLSQPKNCTNNFLCRYVLYIPIQYSIPVTVTIPACYIIVIPVLTVLFVNIFRVTFAPLFFSLTRESEHVAGRASMILNRNTKKKNQNQIKYNTCRYRYITKYLVARKQHALRIKAKAGRCDIDLGLQYTVTISDNDG